jgi:hypothetical protein
VDVGRDPATGRRRQRTKGGSRTKKDAERALAETMRALDEGTHVARDPQTLGEWIERWRETMVPWNRYGGGLAPKAVRNVHIAVRRSLAGAQRFGLVSRNVATMVKPRVPQRVELTTWAAADVRGGSSTPWPTTG